MTQRQEKKLTARQEQILAEKFIRPMVKKMLKETNWAPAIESELQAIQRYTEWLLDENRKSTDKDLDTYIELIQNSLRSLISSRRLSK